MNASFIIYCNTKQRTTATTVTAATLTPAEAAATAASSSSVNTVQADIETKWKDPSGVERENTKGRVHVEKRGGKNLFIIFISLITACCCYLNLRVYLIL